MENLGNPQMLASAGAVIAIVQALKVVDQIPSKFYPLIALVLGIVIGLLQHMTYIDGVLIGATAMGTFSAVKKVIE